MQVRQKKKDKMSKFDETW